MRSESCTGVFAICSAVLLLPQRGQAFATLDRAHRTLLHFRDREVYEERVAPASVVTIATPEPTVVVQKRKQQPWQSVFTSQVILVSLASMVPPSVFHWPTWWDGLRVDDMAWMLPLGVVVGAIPLILRPLSHQHRFRIQDSGIRTYGSSSSTAKETMHHPMGLVSATSAFADEVIYRFYLYHLIESLTGSSLLALIVQAAVYGGGDTETILEGLWYGILTINASGAILPAVVAHTCVDWHRQAVIHRDAMQQMDYIERNGQDGDATDDASSPLRRFCYAFDSRHAGELSRHDMDRALAYARMPVPKQRLPAQCTYEEFEALLREQHKGMRKRQKNEDLR